MPYIAIKSKRLTSMGIGAVLSHVYRNPYPWVYTDEPPLGHPAEVFSTSLVYPDFALCLSNDPLLGDSPHASFPESLARSAVQ